MQWKGRKPLIRDLGKLADTTAKDVGRSMLMTQHTQKFGPMLKKKGKKKSGQVKVSFEAIIAASEAPPTQRQPYDDALVGLLLKWVSARNNDKRDQQLTFQIGEIDLR